MNLLGKAWFQILIVSLLGGCGGSDNAGKNDVSIDSLEGQVNAGHSIKIDLVEGTIDGLQIIGMSIDEATDIFGRPPNLWDDERTTITRTTISYYDIGIQLLFEHVKSEPLEKCILVKIHLKDESETDISDGFDRRKSDPLCLRFPGTHLPAVNRNWKVKQLANEFEGCRVIDRYDAAIDRKVQSIFELLGRYWENGFGYPSYDFGDLDYRSSHMVEIVTPKVSVFCTYEPRVRYIEGLVFGQRRANQDGEAEIAAIHAHLDAEYARLEAEYTRLEAEKKEAKAEEFDELFKEFGKLRKQIGQSEKSSP